MFCDLIGDYLNSPRSGELADFTWGNVGLLFPVYKMRSLEERSLKWFSVAYTRFCGPY